jgi:TfoX/Sxy family transcriptional regulator of competence genes
VSYDPEVADRVRRVLADQGGVTEQKMVGGGLSFLVNGNMCCGVQGQALMVRVGRHGREQALGEPHVQPMLLGGRALSGFITVEPAGFAADGALAGWVRRGLDVAAGLPAKPDC